MRRRAYSMLRGYRNVITHFHVKGEGVRVPKFVKHRRGYRNVIRKFHSKKVR